MANVLIVKIDICEERVSAFPHINLKWTIKEKQDY